MPFKPHLIVSGAKLLRFICHVKGTNRSVAMYMYVSVCKIAQHASSSRLCPSIPTSTVSKTLITPGCLRVRNLRRALRARGRRDLLADMSKENTLHLEASSCHNISQTAEYVCCRGAYSLSSIVQSPDGLVKIHLGIEGIGKCWAFGYRGQHGGLQEVHNDGRVGQRFEGPGVKQSNDSDILSYLHRLTRANYILPQVRQLHSIARSTQTINNVMEPHSHTNQQLTELTHPLGSTWYVINLSFSPHRASMMKTLVKGLTTHSLLHSHTVTIHIFNDAPHLNLLHFPGRL